LYTHQAMMLATSRSRDSENWTSNFHGDWEAEGGAS
jgi:hypothetical protein